MIPIVAPVLIEQKKIPVPSSIIGKPLYCSYFIVSSNSSITSLDQLSCDLTYACNGIDSLSGYHCFRFWLKETKKNWNNYKCFVTGSHLNSCRQVAEESIDCAAIDVFCLLRLERDNPNIFSSIRILTDHILGPFPSQPVCLSQAFSSYENILQENFQQCSPQNLQSSFIQKFHSVNEASYDGLTELFRSSEHIKPQIISLMSKIVLGNRIESIDSTDESSSTTPLKRLHSGETKLNVKRRKMNDNEK